ncbi:MAG: sugar ABC transporter ATP-binding protein [Verrucomicrobia bacterium]|nr:sugar ABC transporter ATP-binding protein [Verrucomicrobiota bacterium]
MAALPPAENLLSVARVCKSYAADVLSDVHLTLRRGEVHALVGENGAGKSTLARIIAGLTSQDAGEMILNGQPYAPRRKIEAEERGVQIVMQELNLVGHLTVAENMFMNRLPHRWGWIDYRRLNADARRILHRVGLRGLDPDVPVNSLGIGRQQLVEIAAGLSRDCRVLILDEPTAALTDSEVELLFEQIRIFRDRGAGILYISHRLEEIQRIADRVTVLRDGKVVATEPSQQLPLDLLIRLMVGRDLAPGSARRGKPAGSVALRVSGLRCKTAVREVSFEACRGEILGFAGLMGSGRTETMRAVFGADRPDAGEIFLRGASRPTRIRSPRDAVRNGIALLTEDRKAQGLLLPLSVGVNMTLGRLAASPKTASRLDDGGKNLSQNVEPTSCPPVEGASLPRGSGGRMPPEPAGWKPAPHFRWINADAQPTEVERWMRALSIRCRSPEQPVQELSGGNQQKVVLAKWLLRDCEILIFDEPTRGIDVGAKFEIYELLASLAEKGKTILVVSSDLKELLALCDRIVVMSAGRVAATFARNEWSQDKIMAAALSGYLKKEVTNDESRMPKE